MVNGDSITETMLKYTRKNKEKLDISEGHEHQHELPDLLISFNIAQTFLFA